MRMVNAFTLELDEPEVAVAEILEQIDIGRLDKNSAGFITCSYDFVETGIVKAICGAMPFDVAGCTTLTNANNRAGGSMLLCLSVLTADDCEFVTGKTGSLASDHDGAIESAWSVASDRFAEPPSLVLAFMPMIASVGGELMLNSLDRVAHPAPVFGTVACDYDTAEYSNSFVIYNGECERNSMALLAICGNIHPRFVVISTSDQNLQKQQAIITSSEGSLIKEINGMSARDYLKSIGLVQGSGIEAVSSVPFVVDYGDGTQPIARAVYSLNEDGSAICSGVMPEGGNLMVGRMDVGDILLTAEQSLEKLLAPGGVNGIIALPCLGRNMVLGMDPMAEIEKVKEVIGDRVPWHLAYSGGEICPIYGENGETVNRFHNFTYIACAF